MPEKLRILLIEDDLDDIEFLRDALSENHVQAELETLIQGDKVAPWLESVKKLPDVIIMDLNLPKMHGREVLCLIRKNKKFDKVPIMVLTTSSLSVDKDFCLEHGANRFHTKPTSAEGFMVLIKAIESMAKSITT